MIPRLIVNLPRNSIRIFIQTVFKRILFNGKELNIFEKKFKKFIGSKYVILVPSARVGFYLILKSLDIKKGDEIILSAYNTPIIPNIILSLGAKPIFIDVDPSTYNIDYKRLKEKISKKTKALIMTHIEGQPCKIDKIAHITNEYKIKVIEDCSHACGATFRNRKVGSFGIAGFFSFGLGKHINTLGGGAITTNDPKIAKYCSSITTKAENPKISSILKKLIVSKIISKNIYLLILPFLYLSTFLKKDFITLVFEDKGTSKVEILKKSIKKFTNFQAILGLKQFKELENHIKQRRKNAFILNSKLNKKIKRQRIDNFKEGAFLNYTIQIKNRKKMIRKLLMKGVDIQPTWMRSCPHLNEFKKFKINCPESIKLEKEAAYIPIYPSLKEKDMLSISKVLNNTKSELYD